jgi:ubiquinone/menaquinone biosynthesis C-methylase UbiE
MNADTLAILCSPVEHAPLALRHNGSADGEPYLCNEHFGLKFPVRSGIPIFVERHEITGSNKRFRRIYDTCAPFYDLLSKVGLRFFGISEPELREGLVERLELKAGDKVLATSVGTGADLPYVRDDARYYGLDLSAGMLSVCRKQLPDLAVPVELFLGQAEYLPFKDDTFDVVYQMGGINFFSDQSRAIAEMARVAKPGARIVVMDETEKVARYLQYVPGISAWFNHSQRPIVPPWALVPEGMETLESCELYDGFAWYLSFRKPA